MFGALMQARAQQKAAEAEARLAEIRYGHKLLRVDNLVRITYGGHTLARRSTTLCILSAVWPVVVGAAAGLWLGRTSEECFLAAFLVSFALTMIRKAL